MGLRNQQLIRLAAHHCTRMEFRQSGGRGMAEEARGLPINMREVRCPVAHGSMSSNLELIIPEFYREHCVGCHMRSPTGQVPNLATYVAEQDAVAAEAIAQEAQRVVALREEWTARGRARRALVSQVDDVMAAAVSDIALLDPEPGVDRDPASQDQALGRLRALAERAPLVFTQQVVAHAVELLAAGQASESLLDPLRVVARARPEFAHQVVGTALAVLEVSASVPAGRCLADLFEQLKTEDVNDDVCRSLVILAGAPQSDGFMRRPMANDPVGLIAVADLVRERLVRLLRSMLPGPAPAPELVLPPGAKPRDPATLFTVGSAAGAVRILSVTHPDLARELVKPAVLQLSSDEFDSYDDEGLPALQRALAVMLVGGVGDVVEAILSAGAGGSEELRERLMRVLAVAHDLVSEEPRWREPGDPLPTPERAVEVADLLFDLAIGRLSGDWGAHASAEAADLIEDLTKARPAVMLERLPALLGCVLELVGRSDEPVVSSLHMVGVGSPMKRALEAESSRIMRGSAIGRLLNGVKALASADPTAVVAALSDVLVDERANERGSDLAYYLLDTLGDIGSAYGDVSGVLQAILPVLYTHLLGTDVGPRARALDAWVRINRRHRLPSSLVDLLPALASDPYVAVARALLRASVAVDWPPDELPRLLLHAATMLKALKDGSNDDGVKEAITATLGLAARLGGDSIRQTAERAALEAADTLGPHALKDVLRRPWSEESARSTRMTRLRFKQAVDPTINDRFNQRDDDPELVALLACGPGLVSLPTQDLIDAALEFGEDRGLAAAALVEVAWRAGRLDDTVAVADALLAATPDQPAYRTRRLFFDVVATTARADATAASGGSWSGHADEAAAAVAELVKLQDAGPMKDVADSAIASIGLRRLLTDVIALNPVRPSDGLRLRADELVAAGQALASSSAHATATGAYLRAVAAFCEVVAHLFRAEAAAFEAASQLLSAHRAAAQRRCDLIVSEVTGALGPGDPLGRPFLDVLELARTHVGGDPTSQILNRWAALPIPLPVVSGTRRSPRFRGVLQPSQSAKQSEGSPVAVVLASLDGHLITGPAVLRLERVYQLSVRVQTGDWPVWASRLDGELLSHLTQAEITTPAFSWLRADHVGDRDTYEQDGSVVLRYSVAAGTASPPLLLRLTWRGEENGTPKSLALDVAGHRELRFRPYDETRDRATDNPIFDERLLEMYDRLARSGFDEDQLQAFCRLFTSICRVGLAITWEKKYRRGAKVAERVFHDDIHSRLMADPELGGRVERGSPLALGFLDVRHDGITAELKVERQTPVTKERAPKYMGQPTQYAAADGARLSILAILDMSPKQMPIGTPENYLFELVPKLHGLDNPEAPSIVAVLVVNGNMPTPSSWSRKKTPVQEPTEEGSPAHLGIGGAEEVDPSASAKGTAGRDLGE